MKYLKFFESQSFNPQTLKILNDMGVTEEEYKKDIELIGKQYYSMVMKNIPFYGKMIDNDYNLTGYDNARKFFNFCDSLKKEIESFEEVEDYFINIIEVGNNDIKIKSFPNDKTFEFRFVYQSLTDVSKCLDIIDKRFKIGNVKYSISSISTNEYRKYDEINDKFDESRKEITMRISLI